MPKIICVIPARLGSTRFPRKILAPLKGKPLIQHVYESAKVCPHFDQVVVAVDAEETADVIRSFGGVVIMTSPDCQNGTERLVELHQRGDLSADVWVNWQGDEPFIKPEMIDSLLQTCDHSDEEIWTLKKRITEPDEITSPHVCKVVVDSVGCALYFSRSPIPFYREEEIEKKYFKHLGIYAYSSRALEKIATLQPCLIEEAEKLEQLRYLYHGLKIRVHETHLENFGIDTPEEMALAESATML